MYTKAYIEIYNWHYKELVYETHRIVELEKYSILTAINFLNLGRQQFYNICKVLQCTHVVSKDAESYTSLFNNYDDWDQFNQLYDPE